MGKGRNAEACQCSELPPHDLCPPVLPVKGRVLPPHVGEPLASQGASVPGSGSALEIRPCLNESDFQAITSCWMDTLFGNVGGQNGSRKAGTDNRYIVL